MTLHEAESKIPKMPENERRDFFCSVKYLSLRFGIPEDQIPRLLAEYRANREKDVLIGKDALQRLKENS